MPKVSDTGTQLNKIRGAQQGSKSPLNLRRELVVHYMLLRYKLRP